MISARGTSVTNTCQTVAPNTHRPIKSRLTPFTSAAFARTVTAMPITASDRP